MRWAKRSRAAFGEQPARACFGIVQGGVFPRLRERSAAELQEIGFDGYAVGGLAVGEGQTAMFETLEATVPYLPSDQPRYLMGVGKPDDIVGAVRRGIDMFDCVLPTRSGRNGQAFTWNGPINLRNARHADDLRPLDLNCGCPACRQFKPRLLHHLVKANEVYRFHVADVAQPDILPEPYGGFARGDHFHFAFGFRRWLSGTISGTARKNARPNILIFGGLGRLTHPVPAHMFPPGESP